MTEHTPTTAATICDRIGRGHLAQALGVGRTAISNAVVEGTFPAKWFLVMSRMCGEAGIECPPHLFRFASGQNPESPQ